jgi:SPP1 gp7 family putative phage head morphogenesis protein
VKELNDAVLAKVEQEGAMKAIGTLFALLSIGAVGEIADSFYEPQLHAEMLGRLEDPATDWSVTASATSTFSTLPFKEAVEYFKSKRVVTPAVFSEMDKKSRDRAFSMAGVHARYVLETAHEALFQSIAAGTSDVDALKRIRQSFADAGVESPSDFHLETVFDTSVLGAYAGGRYAQLTDPDVLAARPYWEYLTAGDGRVRPAHREMAHRVMPADSPTWSSWFPPNGYRCRCSVRSLSHAEAYARGLTVETEAPPTLKPDPGFSGSPGTQHVADGAIARLRGEAASSGVLGQAAADLDRAGDRQRAERVDAFAKMTRTKIVESFIFPTKLAADGRDQAQRGHFAAFDIEPLSATRAGEYFVEWTLYSQDLDSFEQLVARMVQTPGLGQLAGRLQLVPRAEYVAGWDAFARHEPEAVFDDELAAAVGLPFHEGGTVARLSEYALRASVTTDEISALVSFVLTHGERAPATTPVRRAWEVADIRVRGDRVHQLDLAGYRPAYRNGKAHAAGLELVTVARTPLRGFSHEPVLINARRWGVLS